MVLGFLFLGQFAENDGFQIHLSPYKGHELIVFYGCIVFHSVYVPHFLFLFFLSFFFETESHCYPGWSTVVQSLLTANPTSPFQAILPPEPPE